MKNFILILCFSIFYGPVNAQQFIPDPDEIYHIQAENGQYLASGGTSNDAYTIASLSEANSSDDVEWQFAQHSSGQWHIQIAAGGTRSRIRSDGSDEADMQATSSSGVWTQYEIEESPDYTDAHYLTTINSGHTNNRLQLNLDGNAYKVTDGSTGTGVSVRILKVEETVNTGTWLKVDYTHLYYNSNGDAKTLPINVAHRGKWEDKNTPENSQEAIKKAENDDDIDWMEIDVKPSNIQITGSGDDVEIISLQPIIFHDDYPHRLISSSTWADNDLVYDHDMSSKTLSDRFGNETNEPLMTLEDFFEYITTNGITKPINLDISNKSYLSDRIVNGSQAVTDVYDIMFLKAVNLIYEYELNDQVFLKYTYPWNHKIWGIDTNDTNTDTEGEDASVTSIMNFHETRLGIMYTPKFGEETYDENDNSYWSSWLQIAKTPIDDPHPATVIGMEIRLKQDDGTPVSYALQTYINEAAETYEDDPNTPTVNAIRAGIFSEGTVACEGTWDNLASKKYVDFTQDRRNSVEWLDTKGYGYIITDFPNQLAQYKNRNTQERTTLGNSQIPARNKVILPNTFDQSIMHGGFSISGISLPVSILYQENALVEMRSPQGNILWRLGTTETGEIYIGRLMKNGESWRVNFWEPRETGAFSDITNEGANLYIGVTVNDLETRIYVGTPDGKFDCLYLDYGLTDSILEGEFKNGNNVSVDYKQFELDFNNQYQSNSINLSGQLCRTDMFDLAVQNYFEENLDHKEVFSFLNDENPYFSNANVLQKTANEKAFNGEPIVIELEGDDYECTPREDVGRRLDEVEDNLYLIIGQSNAAGRGILPDELVAYEAVSVFNSNGDNGNGSFEAAYPNLNTYSTIKKDITQGYSLGYTFGGSMKHVKDYEDIKLVVNARGGTSISNWAADADVDPETDSDLNYFDSAVASVKQAEALSGAKLAGILWHQGESDRSSSSYVDKLEILIEAFRGALGEEISGGDDDDVGLDISVVVGELSYEKLDSETLEPTANDAFNSNLTEILNRTTNIAIASAVDLSAPDETHFDSQSLRDFGDRYALEMLILKGEVGALPSDLPTHPELVLTELADHDTRYVYRLKSSNGYLLAGNAEEDNVSAILETNVLDTDTSVEWKFVNEEDSSGVHIDLNSGGGQSRLFTKESDNDGDTSNDGKALLTKTSFKGSNTYFFLQESSTGADTYHITALNETDSSYADYLRLELGTDGEAYMVSADEEGLGTIFTLQKLAKEVTVPEILSPNPTKKYTIDALSGYRLAADGDTNTATTVSQSDFGEHAEWKFIAGDNGYYYIELANGGDFPVLKTDGSESSTMAASYIDNEAAALFLIEERSAGEGVFHITATDVDDNFYRLFLNGVSGIVGVSDESATGSWSTFTINEVAEHFDPMATENAGKVFHIESAEGNLLAGYGKQDTPEEEAASVASTTTGIDVEWKFVAHDSIANVFHIDLNTGGQESRLYTKGTGVASLTQDGFSGTNTYFVMQENSAEPGFYHITAIDDTSGFNRLQLDSNGDANMVSTTIDGVATSFKFNEVEIPPAANFLPDTDKTYTIDTGNRRLASLGLNNVPPFTTSLNTDGEAVEWTFIDIGDNYYQIQLVNGVNRLRLQPNGSDTPIMVTTANNAVQNNFIMEETSPGSEEYYIISRAFANGLNTLQLNNNTDDTSVEMVARSDAGYWATFTINEVAEYFDPMATENAGKVFHIESAEGNLLAGYGKQDTPEEEAASVASTTTGIDVEWKFVAHESIANVFHIDLNAGGQESRLYTKGTGVASLTENGYTSDKTYFVMEENSAEPGFYHITAIDDTSGFNRLQLDSNGDANMVSTTIDGVATSFKFNEVEIPPAANFLPDTDKTYTIDTGNRRLASLGLNNVPPFTTSLNTDGETVEWKFIDIGDNYYQIQLVNGGNRLRLHPNGSDTPIMVTTANTAVQNNFIMEETSPGSEEYYIISRAYANGLNTLQLNNNTDDTSVEMVALSDAGYWATFTINEVAQVFEPDVNKVYHIESVAGNLLAGDGSEISAALETTSVTGTTTGNAVEWRFFPSELNDTGYHIDLVEGGEQSRLYTNGSGTASLTENGYTSDKTYFVMEERNSGSQVYGITAVDDTSGFNRLELASNGDTNMISPEPTEASSSNFIFHIVGSFFEPQANTSYHIEASNGHRLDTSGTDISTTTTASGSYADASWKFVKNENGYYHIDFSSEVFGIRRIRINYQGVVSLVDVSDVGSNTQFQMRESDQTPGSYYIQAPNGSIVGKRLTFIDDGLINTAVGNALGNADFVEFKIIEAISATSLKASILSDFFIGEESNLNTVVYPNPSSEIITIQGLESSALLFMYNLSGNMILETKDKEINISELSKGLYYLKTAGGETVLKFIKQ